MDRCRRHRGCSAEACRGRCSAEAPAAGPLEPSDERFDPDTERPRRIRRGRRTAIAPSRALAYAADVAVAVSALRTARGAAIQ